MTGIDLLVKLRDHHQALADAYNDELEKLAPPEAQERKWDPNKIGWVRTEGSKGFYDRYPAQDQKAESTENYKNMLADLKTHGDKFTRDGYFYWLFTDGATVGRKKRK